MKKKWVSLLMALILTMGSVMAVHAESYEGKKAWTVTFDGKRLVSNFKSSSINDNLPDQFQPGDDVTFSIKLANKADYETDWYITNEVLTTLEDSQSSASGGNYTYRLFYKDKAGSETVLYDSSSVGGEKSSSAGEGLHEATNSMEDYLYLDSLKANGTGTVYLYLKVDGETQGNGYQDTLAKLRMNFAVERTNETGTTSTTTRQPDSSAVKTGDENRMLLWALLALLAGIALMAAVAIRVKKGKEEAGS